jgi:Delta4-3-oxosteroid 5beta-reductase
MFCNVISTVVTNCPGLIHVTLHTSTKHYIGPLELIGKVGQPEPPYTEDMPRLGCPNFYYNQEDILFDEVAGVAVPSAGPCTVPASSSGSPLEASSTSSAASPCTLPFAARRAAHCSGRGRLAPGRNSAMPPDLIAEQHIWVALDPMGKNCGC